MIPFIEHGVGYAWMVFGILWLLAAFTSKRTVQRQTDGSRLFQVGLALLGFTLVFNFYHWFVSGWLVARIIPQEMPYAIAGAALVLAGMLFCVWARVILGTNWSGTVTIKEDHQLIQNGPYQIVRHPIYTGLLIALLGTAFVFGLARCFMGVLVVGLALWLKSQTEERFMLQQFGEQYAHYRKEVRALIPFVL